MLTLFVSAFARPKGVDVRCRILNAPAVLLNGAVDAWYAPGGATSKEVLNTTHLADVMLHLLLSLFMLARRRPSPTLRLYYPTSWNLRCPLPYVQHLLQ